MSVPSKAPLRLLGAIPPNSGFPNTGESQWTQGGMVVATVFSGGLLSPGSGFLPSGAVKTADQLLLVAGAGRINLVQPLAAISGTQLTFYDSSVAARSGVAGAESGYRVIGVVPGNTFNAPFGTLVGPYPLQMGMPFTSGLCVNCVSGTPGFSVSFTPETNPTFP